MAVRDQLRHQQFETVVWPHATAAYNLARWICCNEANSADIVQELVRAMQYLETYRDNDLRSWLLTIVRNTAYKWLQTSLCGDSDIGGEKYVTARSTEHCGPDDPLTELVH